ncbi:hypothetical protein [Acetobacter senegalensis]|uniref:hypothetical protein n=1 Tax=Acetobacter senegalensis TaxID=446692 RepID=UPI001EDC23A4|nr:hypothetical protein [Acetobacter senegalensis]MCG4258205.1 hypothetical protein [Acetobacter senegalensis]MCG4268132.1 hypothetical protein [Acetobacter senegalensis]
MKKIETAIIGIVVAISMVGGRLYVEDYKYDFNSLRNNKTEFVSDIYPLCSSNNELKISSCAFYIRGILQSSVVVQSIFKNLPLGCNLQDVKVSDLVHDLNKWAEDNMGSSRDTSAAGEVLVLAKQRAVCPNENTQK